MFCFTTTPELVGEKQNKSWCCRVISHERPTTENWQDYFVGYTTFKDYAWSALEPGQKIDVLAIPALEGEVQQMTALLPGDEADAYEASYERELQSEAQLVANRASRASYDSSPSKRTTMLESEAAIDSDVGF